MTEIRRPVQADGRVSVVRRARTRRRRRRWEHAPRFTKICSADDRPRRQGGGVTGAPRGRYVDLVQVVARSQIPVIASPTYKASYTGRLKAFLDRYGDGGLGSCIAVPLMTGGSRDHSLAVDLLLRPLLVELGAAGRGWGDASPVVVGFRA